MKIVVLAGGLSTERQVALTSGTGVCRALRERGHQAILVDMFLGLEQYHGRLEDIFDAPDGLCGSSRVESVEPDLEAVRRSRIDQSPSMLGKDVLAVCRMADIVFLALHGACGEDGRIQATLDLLGVPDTREELEKALRNLLRYGDHVVVEKKIKGREIQIAVLGDTYLPAVEIIPKGAYFDYVSKYQKDGAVELCPAPITDDEWKQVGELALRLHRALGLSVYSRADFILDENGLAWCLEINTLPGMTPTSLVPQEAAQVGLSYGELCERIVELSLAARKAERA